LATLEFESPVPRVDAIDSLMVNLSSRLASAPSSSQKSNPVIATQAAPGVGKSYFLDYLCQISLGEISAASIDLERSPGLDFFESALCIPITFNGLTSIRSSEASVTARESFYARLFYSCFFTQSTPFDLLLSIFLRSVKEAKLAPFAVIREAIFAAAKEAQRSSVFLLVDELMKSGGAFAGADPSQLNAPRVRETLAEIGDLLDFFPANEFGAVVTSLVHYPLVSLNTSSGRPINWIPLRRATVKESLDLFPTQYEDDDFNRSVQWCAVDCGGHFQSLRCLREAIKDLQIPERKNFVPYLNLRLLMVDKFQYRSLPRKLVEMALRSSLVSRVTPISGLDGNDHTLEWYILMGVLTNSESGEVHTFIPKLTPAILIQWSLRDSDNGGGTLPLILEGMLNKDGFPEGGQWWPSFEKFHCYWEALWRELKSPDERICSLPDFYGSHGTFAAGLQNLSIRFCPKVSKFVESVAGIDSIKVAERRKYVFHFNLNPNHPDMDALAFEETDQGMLSFSFVFSFTDLDLIVRSL